MKWSSLAILTLVIAYLGTGLMNVCEVGVVPVKLLFTPAVAVIAAASAFVVANARQAAQVFGVVGLAAIVGQAAGYWRPWICFN